MLVRYESHLKTTLAFLLVSGIVACSDDNGGTGPDPLTRDDLVGSYQATTLQTTIEGVTTDALALGAELDIVLAADGTTSGRFFVPAGALGSELDESLDGLWTFDTVAGSVTFDMDADTFVRDIPFSAARDGATVTLSAQATFGGITINGVLRQQ